MSRIVRSSVTSNLGSFPEHRPLACRAVERHRLLDLFDVAASAVERRSLAVPREHECRVRRAREPRRAAQAIEGVLGFGFAGVVHDDNRDPELGGQRLQPFEAPYVVVVDALVVLLRWPNLIEHVDDDHARVFGGRNPSANVVKAARVKPRAVVIDGQSSRVPAIW